MAGTITELLLLSAIVTATGVLALAPVVFLAVSFWKWHRELARLRPATVALAGVPARISPLQPLSASAIAELERLAS